MSASGSCYICKQEAFKFHYTRPRKDIYDIHEGYWHCDKHGPIVVTETGPGIEQFEKDPHAGMNRAQRRALKRGKS